MFKHLLIFLALPLALFGVDPLEGKAAKKLSEKHYKEAIADYLALIAKGGDNLSKFYKQLAVAYSKDQESAKAFSTYLKALDLAPKPLNEPPFSDEEKTLYSQALKIYLDPRERNPDVLSLRIREVYAGTLRLHPEYVHLGYLVAVANANLSNFDEFFEIFYRSYLALPDHYLAFKTKGILHIKLFERAKTPEEKERERKAVLADFEEAKKRYKGDSSLYRLQIAYSPEADKNDVLRRNLKEIIDSNMILPRSDLSFYFDQLFAFGDLDLARDFLAKARKWYPYSRTLDAAEAMIKNKQEAAGA